MSYPETSPELEAQAARDRVESMVKKNINPVTGEESNYARKKRFLNTHPEFGGFGFNVPEPKPWRAKR